MKVRIFTEPQDGATYDDQLRAARLTQDAGFDGYFRADHYLATTGDGGAGPTDAWLTLAALARETHTIRIGTVLSSATFRLPGPLAIAVAQVDHMSAGRVELGLGAGWYEREHLTYDIPFPALGERFDRLTEQLEIITGLWATPPGDLFNFTGKHYTIVDAPALPRTVQRPRPPIILGGRGAKRTPRLAAQFADEYNVPFASPTLTGQQYDRVRAACVTLHRPEPPVFSACLRVYVGRTDAQARARLRTGREKSALPPGEALAGSAAEVVDWIGRFVEVGAQRVYLRVDLDDPDHIELIGSEVLPQLS